jgi:hypothetical protein
MTTIFSVILAFMLSIWRGVNQNVNLNQTPNLGLKFENRGLYQVKSLENNEQKTVLRIFVKNLRLRVEFISVDPIIKKRDSCQSSDYNLNYSNS